MPYYNNQPKRKNPYSKAPIGMPTTPPNYPGGLIGEQADYGLRDKYSGYAGEAYMNWLNTNNRLREQAAGMPGRDALSRAASTASAAAGSAGMGAGSLREGIGRFEKLSGYYTPELKQALTANAYNQANNAATAGISNMNTMAASRGLASNPGAVAAMSQRGMMQAGAARGMAGLNIAQQDASHQLASESGAAGLRQSLASLGGDMSRAQLDAARYYATPDRESAMDLMNQNQAPDNAALMKLYEQWLKAKTNMPGGQNPNYKPQLIGRNNPGISRGLYR